MAGSSRDLHAAFRANIRCTTVPLKDPRALRGSLRNRDPRLTRRYLLSGAVLSYKDVAIWPRRSEAGPGNLDPIVGSKDRSSSPARRTPSSRRDWRAAPAEDIIRYFANALPITPTRSRPITSRSRSRLTSPTAARRCANSRPITSISTNAVQPRQFHRDANTRRLAMFPTSNDYVRPRT